MTAALLALALSAVSTSKIGVVVDTNDADAPAILAACPALVVVRLPMPTSAGTLLGNYRANCTGGVVIAQVGGTGMPVDGTTVAPIWPTWLTQILAAQLSTPLAGVEGPWEPTGSSANVAAFWSAFALQVRTDGFLPVVGALAPASAGQGAFCDTVTAVRNALPAGAVWAWSYHARSTSMSQDAAAEAATTLGYRGLQTACGLSGFSLYLTQAGPGARAWIAGDVSWLAWLDGQIGADAYVVGAAAGGTGGPLAPIASELAAYLANPQPPDAGTPDGGTDAGGSSGGVIGGGGVGGIGSPPKTGCATTGAGFTLLALVPVLAVLRRRRSPTVKR
jgi:uncharacterized protein (TIGR03382 family)